MKKSVRRISLCFIKSDAMGKSVRRISLCFIKSDAMGVYITSNNWMPFYAGIIFWETFQSWIHSPFEQFQMKYYKETMKFYNLDGTLREEKTNDDFGWFLNDFILDENEPNYAQRNQYRFSTASLTSLLPEYPEDDSDESENCTSTSTEPREIRLIRPQVQVFDPQSVQNTSLRPEGLASAGKLQENPQELLSSLINPCNSETQMLLSVVNNSKYRKVVERCRKNPEDILDFVDVRNEVKRVLSRREVRETQLGKEVRDFKENGEESALSLMAELILADMNCDVLDKLAARANDTSPPERKAAVNFKLNGSFNGNYIANREKRANILNSVGIGEEIDRSIDTIFREFQDMHVQLSDLKESLYSDEAKTTTLIHDAKSLTKDLKETIFLEDLLHLLSGDLDKVVTKKWPFKVFHKTGKLHSPGDLDLII